MKKRYIRVRSDLKQIMPQKNLYVYGIGRTADLFYSREAYFFSSFSNFFGVVSKNTGIKTWKGASVVTVDALQDREDQIVVVATIEKWHQEICSLLEGRGIEKCFLLTTGYIVDCMLEEQERYFDNKVLLAHYAKIPNMGDLLNELLFKRYRDFVLQNSEISRARIIGIGSSLGRLFSRDDLQRKIGEYTDRKYSLHIWGTGFAFEPIDCRASDTVRKNLEIHAVRGDLSKKELERIFERKIKCVVGDPGLLVKELINTNKIEKKVKVGIIPHYREIGMHIFDEVKEFYPLSKIINLRKDPIKVLMEIAECEAIVSSSLHGIIAADAFGIPNILIKASNVPIGDGFKYKDYYSMYGLNCKIINLIRRDDLPTMEQIRSDYSISGQEINQKIIELKNAMPL